MKEDIIYIYIIMCGKEVEKEQMSVGDVRQKRDGKTEEREKTLTEMLSELCIEN